MKRKGPWSEARVQQYLRESRTPLRLACNGGRGHPVLVSLWYLPEDGRLWCATPRSARVAKLLARDPRCAFEVAGDPSPYCGVRGQGRATLHPERGDEVLRALVERYLDDPESEFARWLQGRAVEETAVAIAPRRLMSWDFRPRMGLTG